MDYKAVPANLRRYMLLRGYSLEHLAATAGMSERTMYKRMKEPGGFTLDELTRLAKKFGVGLERLLETA